MQLRLDKYLADMGIGTRSEVKQYIRKKQVQVNGSYPRGPEQKVDPDADLVTFQGHPISYVEKEYYMFHKPQGCVSATVDDLHKTVVDYITDSRRKDLFPVGRLDIDTEGLLLITNDGSLSHNLLAPGKHVPKTYYAKVSGKVTEEDIVCFSKGIDIGEEKLTLPAELKILSCEKSEKGDVSDIHKHPVSSISNGSKQQRDIPGAEVLNSWDGQWISEIELTITEGKFHQVKRMFEAVGKKVLYLKRISMGGLKLDETLKPGEYRALTAEELALLTETAE